MEKQQWIYSNCHVLSTFWAKIPRLKSQLLKTAFDLRMIWHCLCFSALLPSSPPSLSSSNNLLTFPECPEDSTAEAESEDDITALQTSLERPTPHRGNTMVHVCWHRNTSVSMVDFSIAVEVPAKAQHLLRPTPLLPHCFLSLCLSVCCIFNSLWLFLSGNSILLRCTASSYPFLTMLIKHIFCCSELMN